MGTDEFMGVRPLGFHPVPGEWYRMKVEVCGNRIRIFLNDEEQPHIDITDNNANLVPLGEIGLGGGWIETEFDAVSYTHLDVYKRQAFSTTRTVIWLKRQTVSRTLPVGSF